jgi:GNAT superfamily N-acetyltransferase
MKTTMRRYRSDDDYWRIRRFLREVLLANQREQISWDVARFDYWRWHGILNIGDYTLEDDVFIWESVNGEVVAVLNPEAPGSVFLQIRPDCRTLELETEMLSIAEQYLPWSFDDGRWELHVWVGSEDVSLKELLLGRGYSQRRDGTPEHQRRRWLNAPVAPITPADGYQIRSMGDTDEHAARCWVSWQAFHPNEPDENFEGGWYHNVQRAPLYRRDLDLVAVAPDRELAAFCTIWFDDVTRTGLFEPVGTAPEHQRHGLGKAILTEGFRRLMCIGADLAYVGSYRDPAHALYASVGVETYRIQEPWHKQVAAI